MSAPEQAKPPVGGRLGALNAPWASQGESHGVGAGSSALARVRLRTSGYAWGAIAATATFIALTCWWLTQDRSIPIYDAGDHLETALLFHQMLAAGNPLGVFNYESPYPPFAPTIGALAVFVGGISVASPVIGENVVFVSLLALGVYQTGRLLFGPKAGMLATIFVLGSALLTAQFHVFMIDAPEASVVAVSIWLLLACDDFSRMRIAAIAGLVAGIGFVTKVQYPPFVIGIVLMALLRGGWRNWRGLVAFAVPVVLVGFPWYIDHLAEFRTFLQISTENPIVVPGDIPPLFTLGNFAWYFWNILNAQLLLPLFLLLVAGTFWMIATLVQHRRELLHEKLGGRPLVGEQLTVRAGVKRDERTLGARLEFFVGAVVAWLFITLTPSHDVRYAIPLLPYVAVIATAWIVYLPPGARRVAMAVLALGVIANTLGTTFGVGGTVQLELRHPLPPGEEAADSISIYSNGGFLVAGPSRDGDVPGLLEALHREGVSTVDWGLSQSTGGDFSFEGLKPLALIAKLTPVISRTPEYSDVPAVATLVHEPVGPRAPQPCTRLSDGTGVWVVRYDVATRKLALYCPARDPRYYAVGAA